MSPNDPTDDVLAAIASIFDKPDAPPAAEQPDKATSDEVTPDETPRPVARASAYEGYSRTGPGPLDAIRFKWTARRDDNGNYFVDETIGDQSRAISSGPMPESEIVAFVDARVQEAQDRFDQLKTDMTVRPVDVYSARIPARRTRVDRDDGDDRGY